MKFTHEQSLCPSMFKDEYDIVEKEIFGATYSKTKKIRRMIIIFKSRR